MNESVDLSYAFPAIVREDARAALSKFHEPAHPPALSFSVRIDHEVVTLPYRIYNNPAALHVAQLTDLQRELTDCLLTRHNDGFVRQYHLARILHSKNVWVPPFVIQLVGEYVIEILLVFKQNLRNLDAVLYGNFLRANQDFFATTERRVISYWNCYYRDHERNDYVGFELLEFFKSLVRKQ